MLVNGALLAHGEVVVIDEEFGDSRLRDHRGRRLMTGAPSRMLIRAGLSRWASVIGLMWVAGHVLKKRGFGPAQAESPDSGVQVELLARRTIGTQLVDRGRPRRRAGTGGRR